jgi:hypothetical protein
MFPSPQERDFLNAMKADLHSGITPQAFGLERICYLELTNSVRRLKLQGGKRAPLVLQNFAAKALAKINALLTFQPSRKLMRTKI